MSEKDPLVTTETITTEDVTSLNSAQLIELYPQKTTYELVTVDYVPEYLKAQFILSHYRVHFSFRTCLESLVRLHNESFNIWTHLLGSFGFLGVYAWVYNEFLSRLAWFHTVLLTVYMLSVSWLLLCSSSFHCFACHSPFAAHCTALLDYSGIGIVILASQWVAMEYALMCWRAPKIAFEVVLGFFTLAVVVGPIFKAFHSRRLRVFRALMYTVLSIVCPVTLWIMTGAKYGFLVRAVVVAFYVGMGLCLLAYGVGIFFYLSHIPERFKPGAFDVFLHSHTIWHVFVLCGAGTLFYSYMIVVREVGDQTCAQLATTWFNATASP